MSDERDVLAVFDALYVAATEARDAEAAVDLFARDDEITFWGSDEPERAHGRRELTALVGAVAASRASLHFEWTDKRAHVSGDVAWVNASGTVMVDADGARRTLPYRVTAVFVRRDGQWLWHTHHGSEPNQG